MCLKKQITEESAYKNKLKHRKKKTIESDKERLGITKNKTSALLGQKNSNI